MDNWAVLEAFIRRVYNPKGEIDPISRAEFNQTLSLEAYDYPLEFTDLVSGQTQTKTFAIASNADFVMTSPRYRAVVDDANRDVIPQVKILLTDTGSNAQLMSDATDISTYFGQIGKAPYDIMYPRIINGRSAMSVQVTSYAAAETYSFLELTFAGVLVRAYSNG